MQSWGALSLKVRLVPVPREFQSEKTAEVWRLSVCELELPEGLSRGGRAEGVGEGKKQTKRGGLV